MDLQSQPTVEWANVQALYSKCTVCSEFMKRNMLCLYQNDRAVDEAFAEYRKHTRSSKCAMFGIDRTHTGNGRHSGCWAFTLTSSPKDAKSVGDLLAAVRKIMAQKSCPVVRYAWYYEDKGKDDFGVPLHPHIHGIYETEGGGRIERKHWRRAWDIWDESKPMGSGFRGGYHRPVRDNESYKDYIKKDAGMHEVYGLEDTKTD